MLGVTLQAHHVFTILALHGGLWALSHPATPLALDHLALRYGLEPTGAQGLLCPSLATIFNSAAQPLLRM